MVVHKIDVQGLAVIEADNNSPIRAHGQGPKSCEIAFQRMQPEGRIIEIGHFFGSVQQRQDLFDSAHMFGIHASGIVVLEKLLQSLVAKILDS
jgi:hypothetical protein